MNVFIKRTDSNTHKKEILDFGIYYFDVMEYPNHKLRRHKILKFFDKEACPLDNSYYLNKCDMVKHLNTCTNKLKSNKNK